MTTARGRSSLVPAIESYVRLVDRFARRNRASRRIAADMSKEDEPGPRWRVFRNEAGLRRAQGDNDLYQIVTVWFKNGGIVLAQFFFTSPSGDWAHFVDYYFRRDGTLAKIDATFNTHYGNFSIVQTSYYDRKGRLLRESKQYLDLTSRKPRRPEKGYLGINARQSAVRVYRRARDLPFYRLLRPAARIPRSGA